MLRKLFGEWDEEAQLLIQYFKPLCVANYQTPNFHVKGKNLLSD